MEAPNEKELKKKPGLSEEYRRNRRGIFVKRFDEVPVADIEIVFPEKDIGLKLIDKLVIGLTALSAIIGGIVMLIQGSLQWSLLLSMGSTVGGKLYQARHCSSNNMLSWQVTIESDCPDGISCLQDGNKAAALFQCTRAQRYFAPVTDRHRHDLLPAV